MEKDIQFGKAQSQVKKFELSHHPSEEVKYGTLKSIIRDSGVKI